MKDNAPAKLRIVDAAVSVAVTAGLADLTVGQVAKAARVSTALVHYHFDTKQALLVALAERVSTKAAAGLGLALAEEKGLAAVDRLWEHLRTSAEAGEAQLPLELVSRVGREDAIGAVVRDALAARRAAIATRLPGIMAEMGSALGMPAEEAAAALSAFLDGVVLALDAGTAPDEVRAAYDAFWLVLVAAGQGARSR